MRACCKHLLVIDDLANRAHDCDLLLDQNLGRCEADYANLIKPHVPKLIGPNYALLRPEFRKLRGYSLGRRIHPKLSKILISMGGIDIDNITLKVLDALQSSNLPEGIQINVVMGSHAPWLQEVQEMALKMSRPTRVLVGVSNMAQIMADSDLAIGAAGGTSWERCCLGLPTLLLVLAPNQYESALALEKAGAAILLENTEQISNLFENSEFAISNFKMLQQVSKAAAALTTGDGAECVSSTILDWYE
jgi:UDP-2,4-diacetamido-2,4,6-trideoxy-beta-L-altropyranose hydrolase